MRWTRNETPATSEGILYLEKTKSDELNPPDKARSFLKTTKLEISDDLFKNKQNLSKPWVSNFSKKMKKVANHTRERERER